MVANPVYIEVQANIYIAPLHRLTEAICTQKLSMVCALRAPLYFCRYEMSAPRGTNWDTSIIFLPMERAYSRTTFSWSMEAMTTPSWSSSLLASAVAVPSFRTLIATWYLFLSPGDCQ